MDLQIDNNHFFIPASAAAIGMAITKSGAPVLCDLRHTFLVICFLLESVSMQQLCIVNRNISSIKF